MAGAAVAQGFEYQSRLLAIGFDDFRKSDFTLIQPLFETYGAHATFNLIGTASRRCLKSHPPQLTGLGFFCYN